MNISTTKGHLTATNKKAIVAILNAGIMDGRVGRTDYFLTKITGGYEVQIRMKDRGVIPCGGSKLRMSTYTHQFKVS